jgi:hypothetical protein
MVSPEITFLEDEKTPQEYKVPAVLDCVLTAPVPVTKKHPYTVPPAPVIENVIAGAADVVTFDGVVPDEVDAANTAVPRTAEPPTV